MQLKPHDGEHQSISSATHICHVNTSAQRDTNAYPYIGTEWCFERAPYLDGYRYRERSIEKRRLGWRLPEGERTWFTTTHRL